VVEDRRTARRVEGAGRVETNLLGAAGLQYTVGDAEQDFLNRSG